MITLLIAFIVGIISISLDFAPSCSASIINTNPLKLFKGTDSEKLFNPLSTYLNIFLSRPYEL